MWVSIGLIVLIILCFLGIEFMLTELKEIKIILQKMDCDLYSVKRNLFEENGVNHSLIELETRQCQLAYELKSLNEILKKPCKKSKGKKLKSF